MRSGLCWRRKGEDGWCCCGRRVEGILEEASLVLGKMGGQKKRSSSGTAAITQVTGFPW